MREWTTLPGGGFDRGAAFLLLAPPFTLVLPLLLLDPKDRGAVPWAFAVVLVLDVIAVKVVDRRIETRADVAGRFVDGPVVEAAARYRLRSEPGVGPDPAWADLRLVTRPDPARRGMAPVGRLVGVVRGRPVAIVQYAARRGDLDLCVIGLIELRRADRSGQLTHCAQAWAADHAPSFTYEVAGRHLGCRWRGQDAISAESVGVLLAALVEVADRLDRPHPSHV